MGACSPELEEEARAMGAAGESNVPPAKAELLMKSRRFMMPPKKTGTLCLMVLEFPDRVYAICAAMVGSMCGNGCACAGLGALHEEHKRDHGNKRPTQQPVGIHVSKHVG